VRVHRLRPLGPVVLAALVIGVAGALLLSSSRARAADPDPAQAAFDRGMVHFNAGQFDKACPAIDESYDLDPRPGTLFTLAECEAKRGRLATALRRYDEYLALYASLPADKKQKQGDREQVSKAARAALAPQVPELTLRRAPRSPPGTRVTCDGAPVAEASFGVPVRLDPGEHVITVQAPAGPATERRVTLGNGEKKALVLEAKEPTSEPAPAPAPEPPAPVSAAPEAPGPGGRRIGAFVSGGVGVVGVVIGAVTGGLALGKKSTVDANCGSGIHSADPTACNALGLSEARSLKALGLASTLGLALGAAGVGTAVVLFAIEPAARPERGQAGRWVGVGVLGTGAAVRGTW
jgi:hypothetical protein